MKDSLIEKHYRENFTTLVKRIAWMNGGDFHAAEDIVQEAYCRALKYKDSFSEGSEFTFWFNRILANVRKDFKKAELEMCGLEEAEDEPVEECHIERGVLRELHKEIDKAPKDQREVLRLHFLYGYSLGQIKQITGVPYRLCDNLIQRFKREVQGKYEKFQY